MNDNFDDIPPSVRYNIAMSTLSLGASRLQTYIDYVQSSSVSAEGDHVRIGKLKLRKQPTYCDDVEVICISDNDGNIVYEYLFTSSRKPSKRKY